MRVGSLPLPHRSWDQTLVISLQAEHSYPLSHTWPLSLTLDKDHISLGPTFPICRTEATIASISDKDSEESVVG